MPKSRLNKRRGVRRILKNTTQYVINDVVEALSNEASNTDLVVVSGIPRSGTHWMFWMLSDVLDCPAISFGMNRFADKNTNRDSVYTVIHRHLRDYLNNNGELENIKVCAIITMVRDPRDVFVSAQKYFDGTKTVDWLDDWSAYYKAWVGNCELVRYEDLLEDTKGELERVLAAFDLQYSVQNLVDGINKNQFDVARKRYESQSGWKAPIYYKGKAGRWREVLSKQESDYLVSKHKEMMEYFGYEC